MSFPRVLIVAIGRINAADTANNALLLRNLLAEWPREHLAQIYSGGSNGDDGFCGHQYQIAPDDRRFGSLFFKLKGEYFNPFLTGFNTGPACSSTQGPSQFNYLKQRVGRYLIRSGLYELLFKVSPSQQFINWVEAFDPDIILAQGYNLSFTWLPLWLKKQLKKPIAYYCSDDWPSYLYASCDGLCAITVPFMRRIVNSSTQQLLAATDVPFSFNDKMGVEYERRYKKSFTTLMHCDDPERFRRAQPIRLHPPEIKSIVATGAFDDSRWPLLLDLEEACQQLNGVGIRARATVLTTRITEEGWHRVKACRFVNLQDDPGHELLPSYLKGADMLYLPETFDPDLAQGYRYSISTKAHLFIFSQRPILVYGHPVCGLVNYAKKERWGHVVDRAGISLLVEALTKILTDDEMCVDLMKNGREVEKRNHDCNVLRKRFHVALCKASDISR